MAQKFDKAMEEYAVVVVYGPRQSGKTTLAKMCCSKFNYANLEDKETRELARDDYKAFFRRDYGSLQTRDRSGTRSPSFLLSHVEGFEIDLIRQEGLKVFPCEIKSAITYSKNLITNLEEYCRQEKTATCPRLVYDGTPLSGLGTADTTAVNVLAAF